MADPVTPSEASAGPQAGGLIPDARLQQLVDQAGPKQVSIMTDVVLQEPDAQSAPEADSAMPDALVQQPAAQTTPQAPDLKQDSVREDPNPQAGAPGAIDQPYEVVTPAQAKTETKKRSLSLQAIDRAAQGLPASAEQVEVPASAKGKPRRSSSLKADSATPEAVMENVKNYFHDVYKTDHDFSGWTVKVRYSSPDIPRKLAHAHPLYI